MTIRRIALVSDYCFRTLGGAQTAIVEQAKALAVNHDVVLLAPASRQLDEIGRLPGITAVGLPKFVYVPLAQVVSVRNSRRTRATIAAALDGVDVVHLHSELGLAAATVQVARERGIPLVQTIHCWLNTPYPIQWLLPIVVPPYHRVISGLPWQRRALSDKRGDSAMRTMTYAVASRVDRIIIPSAHVAAQVATSGLGPIDVIPNALAVPPDATPLERVDGPVRLVWVGRAVEEKRLTVFVRACRTALDRVGPGRLEVEVIGEGESLARARALTRGHPAIAYLGRLPNEEVQRRVRAAHATALTSCGFDNQPMTVVESVMWLRGVVYRDPELTEGLDGGAGIPAYGNADELADRIVELVEQPERLVEASRACVAARETFAGSTFVRRALASYRAAGAR